MTRNWLIGIMVAIVIAAILLVWGCSRSRALAAPVDTDGDGCSNAEEQRYGMDPSNPYDFMDVPPKDGHVDLFSDIFGIAMRFGPSVGNPNYYIGFDRSEVNGQIGPPDGQIDLFNDIFAAAIQFGRTCDETPWCNGNILEYTTVEEKLINGSEKTSACYAVRDAQGDIVDYYIIDDESSYISQGETPGLPPEFTAVSSEAPGTSTFYFSCEKKKTWKDLFRFPIYQIRVHVDVKALRNAGVYTGLVNVFNDWGDQDTWWPWDLNGDPYQWKLYWYTNTGPWDYKIVVTRAAPIKATVLSNVIRTKTLYGQMTVVAEECTWRAWD